MTGKPESNEALGTCEALLDLGIRATPEDALYLAKEYRLSQAENERLRLELEYQWRVNHGYSRWAKEGLDGKEMDADRFSSVLRWREEMK
jgi:hypothetical protein